LRASDNGQNYNHIALLIDLSFYLAEKGLFPFQTSLGLIKRLFNELPSEWLLEFWPYLHLRTPYIKEKEPDLAPNRGAGISLIVAINTKIDQLYENNEKSRDYLRSRLLKLRADLFPTFHTLLINKNYEVNYERANESSVSKEAKGSLFYAFWELQIFFQDPYDIFADRPARRIPLRILSQHLETVHGAIFRIEKEKNGPFSDRNTDPESDNRLEIYHRDDLTSEQKKSLQEFYDNKEFSPSFFVSEDKFKDQLRNNDTFRRTILTQMLISCSFIDSVLTKLPLKPRKDAKPLHHKIVSLRANITKQQANEIVSTKLKVLELLKHIERRQLFSTRQVVELSEVYFLNQKTQFFIDFTNEFSAFEYDDKLKEVIVKRSSFKPRFWAAYGTAQITRHWKEQTGLDLLAKDESIDWRDEIEQNLETLKSKIHDGESKDLNNWKALRLARRTELFKFKHANDETGIDGLYDLSIKTRLDEERSKKDEETKVEEDKLKEEQRIQRLEEEKDTDDDKKRKLSEEITDETRKKQRQDDTPPSTALSVDLDY
jgi:hypothetical protein